AAQNGNQTAVRLRPAVGWAVDARRQHGATALHWAGFHGDAAMTREILKHRPQLDALSHEFPGKALEWALYGSRHGWRGESADYVGTVEALLDAGADVPADPGDPSEPVREVLRRYNRRG